MLRKILVTLAAAALCIPACAQVKLGGHVYVPSATDSALGLTNLNFTADADCDIVAQDNCALTNAAGGPPDASSPYNGVLIINDNDGLLTAPRNVILPNSPGRISGIINFTAQPIIIESPASGNFAELSPNSFSVAFGDGTGYEGICSVFAGTGYVLELDPNGCISPSGIDDGITNANLFTFSQAIVQPTGGWYSFLTGPAETTAAQIYTGVKNQASNGPSFWISANTDPATGTRYDAGQSGAAISVDDSVGGNPACTHNWAQLNLSSAQVDVVDFCPFSAGTEAYGTIYNTPVTLPMLSGNVTNTATCGSTIQPYNGNYQKVVLTAGAACSLTFAQWQEGSIDITLEIVQASTPTGTITTSGVYWQGGTIPVITTTSGAIDFITCHLDGTNTFCRANQNFAVPVTALFRSKVQVRPGPARRRTRRRKLAATRPCVAKT